LVRCIVRLLDPDGGQVFVCGRDLSALEGASLRRARREAAVVFQQIQLVRRRTAIDNVMFGALGWLGVRRSISMRLGPADARGARERLGRANKARSGADEPPGGRARRAATARAPCQRASVLLADEPVASLDPRAADEVLALLSDVAHREGLAVLCVLHQPE